MIKKDQESKQEINTEIYLKKIKVKGENTEETDTIISEEKKQRLKEYQKTKKTKKQKNKKTKT